MHQEHDADDEAHERLGDRQHIFVKPGQSRIQQFRVAIGHGILPLVVAQRSAVITPSVVDLKFIRPSGDLS